MAKMNIITVQNVPISISVENNDDYICLTDMVKEKDGDDHIRNWMRNRNTIEFLGTWEHLHNSNFKGVEFDTFLHEAGANRFNMTPRKWIEATNAVGIISKAGRNGGTYAHKDIAFEFGSWISPVFKLYLITEYQRLKEAENNPMLGEWNVKRVLSKVNYTLHTDAVRDFVIPKIDVEKEKLYVYADEADLLNIALWGCTAKQWRDVNAEYAKKGLNIRDTASINELVMLANLESFNAEMIKRSVDKASRYSYLREIAQSQLPRLDAIDAEKGFRKLGTNPQKI
ncbi:hypothetical protein EZS27_013811 [termite gut metagenome]|uniref:KilA-N domain-containing protein n=1 Tax=termite gut metagenome TaxID=433724 RepID=A0A5J4RWQ1_9ZZZZ